MNAIPRTWIALLCTVAAAIAGLVIYNVIDPPAEGEKSLRPSAEYKKTVSFAQAALTPASGADESNQTEALHSVSYHRRSQPVRTAPNRITAEDVLGALDHIDKVEREALMGRYAPAASLFTALNLCSSIDNSFTGNDPREPSQRQNSSDEAFKTKCRTIDQSKIRDRLVLLAQGASRDQEGELKLMYASFLQASNDLPQGLGLNSKDQISLAAERAAIEAAQLGVNDAFMFLSKSYRFGEFGLRDFVKSFAYAHALTELGSNSYSLGAIAQMAASLTPGQLTEAERLKDKIIADMKFPLKLKSQRG
jgi:hypothetical protein